VCARTAERASGFNRITAFGKQHDDTKRENTSDADGCFDGPYFASSRFCALVIARRIRFAGQLCSETYKTFPSVIWPRVNFDALVRQKR
jgi:hypothetical protein